MPKGKHKNGSPGQTGRGNMTAEFHPQRALIVDMMSDTEHKFTLAEIAAKLDPPLSQTTLSRFRKRLLGKISASTVVRSDKSLSFQQIAQSVDGNLNPSNQLDNLRVKFLDRLETMSQRREKWLSEVENKPYTGEDGIARMDHKALATHDRNHMSALELSAKLAGVMGAESAGQAVTVSLVLPVSPGATASGPASAVIDISKTR
jgi:hypothetical protein